MFTVRFFELNPREKGEQLDQSSHEVTQILRDWSGGDASAAERLMPLVYDELRRLARSYLRRERSDHTLQPTALVNEAYLKLVDQSRVSWQDRHHFFGIAAQMMRRVLVDHARANAAEKRGGQRGKMSLEEVNVSTGERADGEFDQQVALKVVRRSFADSELARRSRRERQILASLNHPNIAIVPRGGEGGCEPDR